MFIQKTTSHSFVLNIGFYAFILRFAPLAVAPGSPVGLKCLPYDFKEECTFINHMKSLKFPSNHCAAECSVVGNYNFIVQISKQLKPNHKKIKIQRKGGEKKAYNLDKARRKMLNLCPAMTGGFCGYTVPCWCYNSHNFYTEANIRLKDCLHLLHWFLQKSCRARSFPFGTKKGFLDDLDKIWLDDELVYDAAEIKEA